MPDSGAWIIQPNLPIFAYEQSFVKYKPEVLKKYHSIKVKDVTKETPDCVSIELDVPKELKEEFEYTQGQHINLRSQINGKQVSRSYSLCSAPSEEIWKVAVKKVPGGQFSTFANDVLTSGTDLDVMPPHGNFFTTLDPDQAKNYVAFAAGSGITPIMSIIKETLHKEPESSFTLFFGNRTADSIIFQEELEDLKNVYMDRFRLYHFLSAEHQEANLFNGRITKEKTEKCFNLLLGPIRPDEVFICGPEPMIAAVTEGLLASGVDKKNIHFELFTSPEGPLVPKEGDRQKHVIEGGDQSQSDHYSRWKDFFHSIWIKMGIVC